MDRKMELFLNEKGVLNLSIFNFPQFLRSSGRVAKDHDSNISTAIDDRQNDCIAPDISVRMLASLNN